MEQKRPSDKHLWYTQVIVTLLNENQNKQTIYNRLDKKNKKF